MIRPALETGTRPEPAGPVAASVAFAWRSVLKVRHVPEQLADVILIPVMFTVLFTYLFGGAIAGSTEAYLQVLLPGTLVMAILIVTIYSGVTLNADVTTGAYDRFRSLPIWSAAPMVGGLIGDIGRYLIASSLVLALGLLIGYRPEGGTVGVALALVLTIGFALSLWWAWLLLGLLLRTPQSVQIIGFVVLVPLTFASNVFVDPSTMPDWLRAFVEVNPVSHLVTVVRDLLAGRPAGIELLWVVWAAALLVAVFAPLTIHRYRRRT